MAQYFQCKFDIVDDLESSKRVEIRGSEFLSVGSSCVVQQYRRIATLQNRNAHNDVIICIVYVNYVSNY